MNSLVSSLYMFAVSLKCQCRLMDQVFLEGFLPLPSHSIAINMIISEIKEVCFDLEQFFFLKKYLLCVIG